MGERRGACRVLVGKPERRKALGRPWIRWEDNIKLHLWKVGWDHELDSSDSGQGQVAVCCECGNEFSGSITCGEFLG